MNLFTLVHETVHLLSFNTGLLARNKDVPACIAEGLATYAELWRTKGKGKMGAPNVPRLKALLDTGNGAATWIERGGAAEKPELAAPQGLVGQDGAIHLDDACLGN